MEDENKSKFLNGIKYTSHVVIKEEIITADNNTSDSESTISDSDRNPEIKANECEICSKYHSMFIILRNHECQKEVDTDHCLLCEEINHWTNCFKIHKDSHEFEAGHSSDSTTSDREEIDGKCKICLKYEFMVPLLSSHLCKIDDYNKKCQDCNEVLLWESCYKSHAESHKSKTKIKEESLSESTNSDNEELEKLNSTKSDYDHCQICLKYEFMFLILEENHNCKDKEGEKCETCKEIQHWHFCFENHKKNHFSLDQLVKCKNFDKSECGVCLKLNFFITSLMKNHCCINKKCCSVCTEVSYWLSCLNNHKRSNLNSKEYLIFECSWEKTNCSICSKFKSVLDGLNNHECPEKKGKQKCGICIETSFWNRNLKQHENNHNKQTFLLKNFLSCSDCGKRFSNEKMLNVHYSYCKSSYFVCDICNKRFLDFNSLKKHKIFQFCRSTLVCKICNKIFSNFLDFKNHEIFHNKIKWFQCSKCSAEFRSEYLLTKHKLTHR